MLDMTRFSTEELRLFNAILEKLLLDPKCELPLTVIARRFTDAIDAGVVEPNTLEAVILGAGTSPGGLGLPPGLRRS